ncbi:MAG: protein CapI [Candidatus Marinimicrobia bacterium]|nr:protein CapI [Candidatus Neomarinimicrobiota bacterium]|tara:strand:+ start:8747 stop:9706 length:960 start_codon:yes stop_codon:yes gene_type:complete
MADKILITGSSGFIGMHLSKSLLEDGISILGVDNMNDYYDPKLKYDRLKQLQKFKNFDFVQADISDKEVVDKVFRNFKPDRVVNLAAQAGVRYSLEDPGAYIQANIVGFMNILEACRHNKVDGLIYASSSSVYGGNKKIPFSIDDSVDKPISIYAASKKSNELMAYSYSHLYGLNTTGLRFFTVYGPWGRPDMAMFIFSEKILNGEPIPVFNHGKMQRDFTFIDDIIEGTKSSIKLNYGCEVFNLGNNKSEDLMDMIALIEEGLNKKARFNFLDIQPGDVEKSFADIDYSNKMLDFRPKTSIKDGIPKFLDWYKTYFNI